MLTVRDLMRDLDVRLLAGERSLHLPVRWVHISELLDPTPWLSGGELLLTTGMQLETAAQEREFAARLADHHLAGLGFGTGFKHAAVPEPLLEVAAEREFPVFEVPYEVPFIAVTEAAFTQLVNEQYAVLRRALAAQERLERIVLSERGLDALVGALSTLIGAAVVVFDSRGEPLQQHAFRRAVDGEGLETLRAEVRERARRREARAFMPTLTDGNQGLALPVASDGAPRPGSNGPGSGRAPEAWLVAIKDAGPLLDFDRLTLHQAVTIVALELLRARVAGDTERRLAGDVLDAIVTGELTGSELARRLGPFGLGERVAAVVLRPAGEGRTVPQASVEGALWTALREEASPALVASVGPLACAMVPGGDDDELFALGERVVAAAEVELRGEPVRVGIGRGVPVVDARRSFHEARCALEALALGVAGSADGNGSAPERPRVATYKDLGSFQLLLSLQDDEALRLFCDSILGPIEASEGPYGGELMRSLEAFIEENGQWERAAKRLYCHRHTLRYRIRRVEELTGRNLGSARDRIEFWLALRGRQLVA
ncbi:MAG: PucR family transcriptional regulator ligand-binding domain-containing protein [Solirubrobacterales bacterium]|nr:PucR family transcriptional regulator ligand-binding domain-containing protein [Solirubrobacterales bacterium]